MPISTLTCLSIWKSFHGQRKSKIIFSILNAQILIREQARLLGIDFNSVFARGSQFKVESLMMRIAKPESFLLLSPSRKQVRSFIFLGIENLLSRLASKMLSSASPWLWNHNPISIQTLSLFSISNHSILPSLSRIIIGIIFYILLLLYLLISKLFYLFRSTRSMEGKRQIGRQRLQKTSWNT